MKKRSKWYWMVAILLLVAVAAWYLFFSSGETEVEYRFDEVKKGDIAIVVTATGTLEAVTTVQVGSQVSGIVAKLYADFNTVVRAGDIVAQLDTTFLRASVKENEANLERVSAQLRDSRRVFDRTRELFDKGLVSQAEFDASKTTFEAQSAAVKQAQASVDRAKVNLRYATIRAPIDGVVISRNVDVGQTVAASFSAPTLFVIANDLTKMQVQASIDEADIGRISLGQSVTFTVDAYPEDEFDGRVSEIRLQPNNVQNVINYTVIIDVPNPDLKLMPGMTANVTILVDRKDDVLKIPNLALRFTPPQPEEEESQHGRDNVSSREDAGGKGGTKEHQSSGSDAHGKNGMVGTNGRTSERSGKSGMQRREGDNMPDFKPFDRQQILVSKDVDHLGNNPRILTDKWKRNVETYRRKEFPGQIWILDQEENLKEVPLLLGISDGVFTEILSGALKEGDRIIVGSIVKEGEETAPNNPFGGTQRRTSRRFRRM